MATKRTTRNKTGVRSRATPAAAKPKRATTRTRTRKVVIENAPGARASARDDPRLPPPGTWIERRHKGIVHRVLVLEDGFEYQGLRYSSLSKIAFVITGVIWNGYLFFRLQPYPRTPA